MTNIHISIKWKPNEKFSLRQIWYMYTDELKFHDVKVLAILLMPNHLHLLINAESSFRLERLLLRVTLEHSGNKTDEIWTREVKSVADLLQVYKYIYTNPVQSGYVRKVEEYPFSSLQFLLGKEKNLIPIHDPFNFITDPIRILNWLNTCEKFSPFYPTRFFGT
ncbi:MAG: hypothetical protein A4S09_09275 [Proteobacteria bacterium SG_bin7]|nr:MAG: hypothetical protein A4S09_09275 [Proteobacteria bacterium SG_bin7]